MAPIFLNGIRQYITVRIPAGPQAGLIRLSHFVDYDPEWPLVERKLLPASSVWGDDLAKDSAIMRQISGAVLSRRDDSNGDLYRRGEQDLIKKFEEIIAADRRRNGKTVW